MSNPYRDKLLSVGTLAHGRTRNEVREGRDNDGQLYKAVKDELGNVVTQRAGDRQDVTINAPHITVRARTTEER
jgi:hypothetical protein